MDASRERTEYVVREWGLHDGGAALRAVAPTLPVLIHDGPDSWGRGKPDCWWPLPVFHSLILIFDRDPSPGWFVSFRDQKNVFAFYRVAPGIYMECVTSPSQPFPALGYEPSLEGLGRAKLLHSVFRATEAEKGNPYYDMLHGSVYLYSGEFIRPHRVRPVRRDTYIPWTPASYLSKLTNPYVILETLDAYRDALQSHIESLACLPLPKTIVDRIASFSRPDAALPFRADRLDVCDWNCEMKSITRRAAHFAWHLFGPRGVRDLVGCGLVSPHQMASAGVPIAWARIPAPSDQEELQGAWRGICRREKALRLLDVKDEEKPSAGRIRL